MRQIKKIEIIPFPQIEICENFTFNCVAEGGSFEFHFKWLNDRWNVWVTLPDGSIRQAGVEPNVISWSGYDDYGLRFNTTLPVIDYPSIFIPELQIITWQ